MIFYDFKKLLFIFVERNGIVDSFLFKSLAFENIF